MSSLEKIKNVPIAEFRGVIRQLERIYHTDRHACVGQQEKDNNKRIMQRIQNNLLFIECNKKKPEDVEDYEKIIKITRDYLGFESLVSSTAEMIKQELGFAFDNETEFLAIVTLAVAHGSGVTGDRYNHLVNQELANLNRNAKEQGNLV